MIKYYVNLNLEINGRKTTMELLATGLGKERIILGFPWLQEQNPDINWKTGKFSWREPRKQRFLNLPPQKNKKCELILPKPTIEEISDDYEWKNQTINSIDDDLFPISMATWTGMFGLTLNQQQQRKYRQRSISRKKSYHWKNKSQRNSMIF